MNGYNNQAGWVQDKALTYNQAQELLSTARSIQAGKPIANNTRLYKRGENIAIRLHDTDIVTITPQNDYILNTGGWYTVTTKSRMNDYIPKDFRISQESSKWYVYAPGVKRLFYEDITLTPVAPFIVDDKGGSSEDEAKAKKIDKLIRSINKYARLYVQAVDDKLPEPSSGDCWFCYMHTQEGEALGDAFKDTDHLISHIDEGYIVPSLAYNAVKEAGYNNPALIIWGLRVSDSVKRSVAQYLKKRLLSNMGKV